MTNASEVVEEMGWVTSAKENTASPSAPVIIDIISDAKQKKSQNVRLAKAGPTEGDDNDSKNTVTLVQPQQQPEPHQQLSAVGQRVLDVLSPHEIRLDEISLSCSDDPQDISQSLVELQLGGFVWQSLGGYIRFS